MRRQKGEGSITKLSDTKARVRVNVVINGVRKPLSRTVALKDAPRVLKELLKQKDNKAYVADKGVTVEMIYKEWKTYVKSARAYNTYKGYNTCMSVFNKDFKYVRVSSIKQQDINTFLDKLYARGFKDSTISLYRAVLKSFFKFCMYKGAVAIDPTADNIEYRMKHPKKRVKTEDIKVITPEDLAVIKKATKSAYDSYNGSRRFTPLYMYTIVILGDDTGMRRSEMLALRVADVDTVNNKLTVSNSVYYEEHEGNKVGDTKTSTSRRFIYVSDTTINALKDVLKRKSMYNFAPSDYVFSRPNGELITPNALTGAFERVLEKCNMTLRYCLHDLRHTSATRLISAGVNIKTVSMRLGHKNIATTLNIYSHYVAFTDQLAASIYEKLGHYQDTMSSQKGVNEGKNGQES